MSTKNKVFLESAVDRQILYENVLYVDANPIYGNDANRGTRDAPFLTIAAAVAAAPEYTTIMCVDSRTGAAAIGFDENAAITGVTIAQNYITIVGYSANWRQGHKVRVGNTIANADNVLNITGHHVILIGLAPYLQDINGDEVTVLVTGDSFRMEHCDCPSYIPANPQNECIRVTGDNPVFDYVHTILSDVGLRFSGSVARVRNSTFQGATEDGILLDASAIDTYIDSCQLQSCGDGIHVTAGATFNLVYECNFANCTTNWNNLGGATNQLIHAKIESQITAGNEEEQDLADIYNRIGLPTGASISADIAEKPEWATPTTGTHTTSGTTEETVVEATLTDPYLFYMLIDLAAMVAGDDFTFRVYQKVDGATYRLKDEQQFVGAQTIDIYQIDGIYGDTACDCKVTCQRASGIDRSFPYRYNYWKEP